VFCHETSASLKCFGRHDIAVWVELVASFFNIINTRSPNAGKFLRDPLREPIRSAETEAALFLKKIGKIVKAMNPPRSKRRPEDRTLTTEKCIALVNTINGFVELSEYLLSIGFSYVLLGRYTNDPIEKLFGKWRQRAGTNYYISVAEIFYSNRIKWAKLTKIYLGRSSEQMTSHHSCQNCF